MSMFIHVLDSLFSALVLYLHADRIFCITYQVVMALSKSPVLRDQSVIYGLQFGDKGFQSAWVVQGYLGGRGRKKGGVNMRRSNKKFYCQLMVCK